MAKLFLTMFKSSKHMKDSGSQLSHATCRFCSAPLKYTFVDLGMSPLCQDNIQPDELNKMEPFYPLHVWVCSECFLVQLEEFVSPEIIYKDYPYFSSYSDTWQEHARRYTDYIVNRFNITTSSLVTELASNDGYLLQYFLQKCIPVLGVEPAHNVAQHAINKGIRTEIKFFGNKTADQLADQYGKADLLIGNNVLAHVPNINDFVSGMKKFLQPQGVITMEFPHVLKLVEGNQFDTIYHEHFSYLSFTTVNKIFDHHGLAIFDVEELPTHGGSLRIFAQHKENTSRSASPSVVQLIRRERQAGMLTLKFYTHFDKRVKEIKWRLLEFLISAKRQGKRIVGYGAPGKGNTLLNYCGIRTDFLDYTVDRNPFKQGNFLPGTMIPIYHPDKIKETKPDYVLILPWNLRSEIMIHLAYISEWQGKFIIPIPEIEVAEPVREVA
jgi:SAM-dependent methyltransferase